MGLVTRLGAFIWRLTGLQACFGCQVGLAGLGGFGGSEKILGKDLTYRVRVATITDMTTTKGNPMELFENTHNGSVCCRQHLGYEATAGFTAKPNAKSVKTAFGTIRKMNEAQVAEWLELVSSMWASGCESCK